MDAKKPQSTFAHYSTARSAYIETGLIFLPIAIAAIIVSVFREDWSLFGASWLLIGFMLFLWLLFYDTQIVLTETGVTVGRFALRRKMLKYGEIDYIRLNFRLVSIIPRLGIKKSPIRFYKRNLRKTDLENLLRQIKANCDKYKSRGDSKL
ncbi:MAG TPA: hypothetical protein PLY93_07555 [Turneriella sp.]|nr:hypothetical protein [Turneriella sp.]